MTFKEMKRRIAIEQGKREYYDANLEDNQCLRAVDERGKVYIFSNFNLLGGECDDCHFDPREQVNFIEWKICTL